MQTEALRKLVVDALEDLKALDLLVMDVREQSTFTDVMVVCSGTSPRHLKALGNNVIEAVKKEGQQPLGVQGMESQEWVLVDCGDVIVHVMLPEVREFYALEKLWTIEPSHRSQDA